MDTCMHRAESVPARRTKSWKREHQQTCTRRFQSSSGRAQQQQLPSDLAANVVVWELPQPGSGTPTRNYNYNYRRRPVFRDFTDKLTTSRRCFRSSPNYSVRNNYGFCSENKENGSCEIGSEKEGISVINKVNSFNDSKNLEGISGKSDFRSSLDSLNGNKYDRLEISRNYFHGTNDSQYVTDSKVDLENSFPASVAIDNVVKCVEMRGLLTKEGQCIRIKTCEEIESGIQKKRSCVNLLTQGFIIPENENEECALTDEELSVDVTMASVETKDMKDMQDQNYTSVDSKYDKVTRGQCPENRGDEVFQTNSELSPRHSVFVDSNLTQIKLLDFEQHKKLHASSSLMDIETNKCKITTESRSKDSILGNNCVSGHFGDCSYRHSCLVSNGLIGYILGQDRHVEIITVSHNDMNLQEPVEDEVSDPDWRELSNYISEAEQRISIKTKLRNINRNVARQRPEEEYFTRLDPSVKKNTAFVRRLKTFTSSQLNGFLKDMSSLNLTKYISEVAAALVESKLKMADVWPAVQLCNIFHQTYSEFSAYLLDNWHKVLSMKKDEQISNQAKLRVDLRFYAELISVGIFTCKEGLPLLGNVLTMLTHLDKEDHYNIKIILSFCRHCGDDYAGLVPRRLRMLSEKYNVTVPHYKLLSEEKRRNVRTLLNDYYHSLSKHLLKEHLALQELTKQNRKILQTRGELGLERKDRLEAVQVSYNRITSATQQLAEVLDKDFPLLPEDESLKIVNVESEEGVLANDLWSDEETRCFYECFPDMKEFVPSFQLKVPDPEPQVSEETLDIEFEGDLLSETTAEDEAAPADDEVDEPEPTDCRSNKALLEAFLATLPQCINQDMIDSAAVKFVTTLNTKHNRRKLVRALFNVSRVRLDLLPFYARFVTIIHAISSDVAIDLAQILKQDFKYHVRKKDQLNIESKIKVVRFIGELVKFRMYSKVEGLYCLKVLVKDFTHHHIEMCCNFLETCGRFFFRHPDCYQRMKIYLDQIMRKKAVMALDSRYVTMIENAYYSVNPPEGIQCIQKERPEEHEFIRKILYQDLAKTNVDEVLCLMLKLDWDEPDTLSYAIKCLTYAFKVKYFNICCMASLLAGLVVEHEFVGTQVIDGVLEDIQLGMEVNLPKYNQRRVAMIKYLGELYNYRMVENSNIFQVLYSLITFGITWDHAIESPLDPPENVFRIRLICVLLDTCGEYFVSGSSKMKLDVYLIFFQYFYWFKFSHPCWCVETPFPIHIIYMFQDTVTRLRPNVHLFVSLSDAKDAVNKFCLEQECGTDVLCETYESDNSAGNPDADETLDDHKDGDETEDHSGTSEMEPTTPETSDDSLNNTVITSFSKDSCFNEEVEEMEIDEEDDDYADSLCELDDTHVEWNTVNEHSYSKSETSNQQENVTHNNDKCGLLHRPTLVECPEDEEFLTAFERMVSDNIQNRMHETIKPQQLDISVPLHIRGNTKKTYNMLREETTAKESTKSIVNFVLMLRKGHKQQYKNLVVPVNSEMALNLKNYEEAERAEKEHVKRLTLNINERLEEEDYQEMLAQTQRPIVMNLNRERRPKYQHLKGVPDSDIFFCPKKVR